MIHAMTSREDPIDRAVRRLRRQLDDVLHDIRETRLGSGISQKTIASRVGISRARLGRIERGEEPRIPSETLARIAGALGLELSLRIFTGGRRLQDAPQIRTLGRFRQRLGAAWGWQAEAPLPIPGDQRAWDLVGTHAVSRLTVWVEAESRLRDSQAVLRRIALKRRDGTATRLILVVNDTLANREAIREAPSSFAEAFPAAMRTAMPLLVDGKDPGADVLVIL